MFFIIGVEKSNFSSPKFQPSKTYPSLDGSAGSEIFSPLLTPTVHVLPAPFKSKVTVAISLMYSHDT